MSTKPVTAPAPATSISPPRRPSAALRGSAEPSLAFSEAFAQLLEAELRKTEATEPLPPLKRVPRATENPPPISKKEALSSEPITRPTHVAAPASIHDAIATVLAAQPNRTETVKALPALECMPRAMETPPPVMKEAP